MPLQKEIWLGSIIKGLFADNTFASKSINHSGFVDNKTVHVPNAGTPPEVKKNRNTLPATVNKVTDIDLTYTMNEYTSDPVLIPHAEQVELSYDKRESVIYSSRASLVDAVHKDLIYGWIPATPNKVATKGEAVVSHIPTATGNRKAMDMATVKAVKLMFDKQNMPAEGRYMLLDADMYEQLSDSMTDATRNNFLAGANPATGVIGMFAGFNFFMRSEVAKTSTAGVIKEWSAAAVATDSAAGIAWHQGCVSRALGEQIMFEQEKAPTFFGDVISFLVRAGGAPIRSDKKGVILIYQDTAA